MSIMIFAAIVGAALNSAAALDFGIPLENFLRIPLGDVYYNSHEFTAGDMHLLGKVKDRQEETFSTEDDGKIRSHYLKTTSFAADGRILRDETLDVLKPGYGSRKTFSYDGSGRLTEIRKERLAQHEVAFIRLTYGKDGHLIQFSDLQSKDTETKLISVSTQPDGRPAEAISRDGTGRAQWRVKYEYDGRRAVTIHYFSAGWDDNLYEIQTIFHKDDQGRVATAEVVETDPRGPMSGHGKYYYSYRPDGTTSLDVVQASDHKNADKRDCREHVEYLANGDIDDLTLKTDCPRYGIGFSVVGMGAEISQHRYDAIGNRIMQRTGKKVIELGRAIVRWDWEEHDILSYY